MKKKRILLVSGVVVAALLIAGAVGATAVFAQDPPPGEETDHPFGFPFGGRGFGGRARGGGFFGMGGDRWTMFDTAAEALGLSPEEYFSELHGGKSLTEIAEDQGVDMDAVQEAMNDARADAMQGAVEQAVEDGTISQEQADWMLEGMGQGFFPMGMGRGRMGGRGGHCSPEGE